MTPEQFDQIAANLADGFYGKSKLLRQFGAEALRLQAEVERLQAEVEALRLKLDNWQGLPDLGEVSPFGDPQGLWRD